MQGLRGTGGVCRSWHLDPVSSYVEEEENWCRCMKRVLSHASDSSMLEHVGAVCPFAIWCKWQLENTLAHLV